MSTPIGKEILNIPYLRFRRIVAILCIALGFVTVFWWVGIVFIIVGLIELSNVKKLKLQEYKLECICPLCQSTIYVYKGHVEEKPKFICPICQGKIEKQGNYLKSTD